MIVGTVVRVLCDDQLPPTATSVVHVCFQTIILYRISFAHGCDLSRPRMFCLDATVCGHTKHVLCVRVCSVSTTFTARHRLSLCYQRSCIENAYAAVFGVCDCAVAILMVHCLLHDRLSVR